QLDANRGRADRVHRPRRHRRSATQRVGRAPARHRQSVLIDPSTIDRRQTTSTIDLRNSMNRFLCLAIVILGLFSAGSARAEKLRDLCDVSGARENQLVGYGIVTGLTGTGDDVSVPFTSQSVLSLLRRLGLQVNPAQLRLRNVAAVMVTA